MGTDWNTFWNEYPAQRGSSHEHLAQVGKTVGGVPISAAQFDTLVADVTRALELQSSDRLLDLCCGNGVVTHALAPRCARVVGADFSEPLLAAARRDHGGANVEYLQLDVRRLAEIAGRFAGHFSKVLCYDAFAYFDPASFDRLLTDLSQLTGEQPTIVLGSVLDHRRRWRFFNTPRRKLTYFANLLRRREVGLGRWWKETEIRTICRRHGFEPEFLCQDSCLHTAHYRFDVRIRPAPVHSHASAAENVAHTR